MRLVRLEIQTLPGIEPGFVLEDIAPGVNVVTGPNAVGKSSLLRAVRYLLAPVSVNDPRALALNATFDNGSRWTVRRTGRQQVWERDGQTAEPPPLPDADALHCYWLSMESLLAVEAGDERLVAELRRALTGGFDLPALRGGDFAPRPRIGQNEARALREAEAELRAAETHYHALRREEADLPRLERDIAAARAAAEQAADLERALALLEALRERQTVEAGLTSFPPDMERLRGDELERLTVLEGQRRELETERETARQRHDEAQQALDAAGLTSGRPDRSRLQACAERLAAAERLRDQLDARREQLDRARARELQARQALNGGATPPRMTPDAIMAAERLASDLKVKQHTREELTARIAETEDAPPEREVTDHMHAVDALRAWLAAAGGARGAPRTASLLAVLGAGAAAAFGALAEAWLAVTAAALALAGTLWAAWRTWVRRDAVESDARRRLIETGLAPPAAWRARAARERLGEIEEALAALRLKRARAEMAAQDTARLERVERELAGLEQQRAELARALGFDPTLTAVGIDHFARQVDHWQRAAEECQGLERTIQRLTEEIAETLEGVRVFATDWGVEVNRDPVMLAAALRALETRCRQADDASRSLDEAKRDIERVTRELDRVVQAEAELFESVGLTRGDHEPLRARLERHQAWAGQRERLAETRRREAEARKALEGAEALRLRAEQGHTEDLMAERDAAREQAERLEALQERRTELRTRLRQAGADHRLEHALAEVETAGAALAARRDEVLLAEAGQCLLDHVEQEYHSEHEPEVLRDARDLFRRFTHHAWDLRLEEDAGLVARDLGHDVRREVTELSSGTRMQLLLALRLAWTRRLERERVALPLFLDEALTTSDAPRFASVAESLQRLADEEGRQVFYLSARRHELELWTRASNRPPHHIDLTRVRFGAEATPEDFSLPETEPLPRPDRRGAAHYAVALGVPPVEPRHPEGRLHLFHLLRDDLELLYRLMELWRITTLGQLEELLGSDAAAAAIPDPARRRALAGRCATARAWMAAWRRGRGRPVDRLALELCGAVSDAFLDRVSELANVLEGDPRALLDALRDGQVRHFRSNTLEELEGWLVEQGYIDDDEPLDAAARERRTLQGVAGRAPPEDVRRVIAWLEGPHPVETESRRSA